MKKILFLSLAFCWVFGACTLGQTHEFASPQQEIVYQAIQSGEEDRDATVIGFINKDGSGSTIVDIGFRAGQPVYSRKMQGLLFHVGNTNPIDIDPYATFGDVVFLTLQGNLRKCKSNDATWFITPTTDPNIVFVHDREELQLLDIRSCSIVKTLLKKNDLIGAASLSESEKYVIFYYGNTYPNLNTNIFVMSVDSTVPQKVIETALNGSISPDDEKIAFVQKNGIYISNLDGSEQTKLVSLELQGEVSLFPFPQWSPDGRYLIYHKCQNKECYHLKDFSMYLFDLETMVETKIADNGLFPTWIR
jgi:hypothetical protein